jgi:heme-degrading monooxygenase HmoA
MKFIFVRKVKSGKEKEFVKAWNDASKIIQMYPGAQGTKLHQSLTNPRIFLAYASWESKQARDYMETNIKKDHPSYKRSEQNKYSKLVFADYFNEPISVKSLEG